MQQYNSIDLYYHVMKNWTHSQQNCCTRLQIDSVFFNSLLEKTFMGNYAGNNFLNDFLFTLHSII